MPASERDAGRRAGRAEGQRTYAGIGSRQTPADVLALIGSLAERLAGRGWVLRTGASPGADQAFYRGALAGGGQVELYLPWPRFEAASWAEPPRQAVSVVDRPAPAAYELAARFHPDWATLGPCERPLLARDGHQVLGADLASPAAFVGCWTTDGSLDGAGLLSEGTGQALRIAHANSVPVFNLARPEHVRALSDARSGRCPRAGGV
ncbi:MAG TPA: hypothetical protein VGN08_11650 [Solirubrobacteraceae bacterium]|jgi:hypothetical protein